MKRFSLLLVAALFGAAVSAPAQFSKRERVGRHHRGPVVVQSKFNHGPHRHTRSHRHARPTRHLRRAARSHRVRWETRYRRVHVPGFWDERVFPPTHGWIYDSCGRRRWGIVDPGGCRRVWVPPRWESRPYRCRVRF